MASEFYYLETGAILFKYFISSLNHVSKNILSRNDRELIGHAAQRDNPTKYDFIRLVKGDLEVIGESFDEIDIYSIYKSLFKQSIKKR